ncbi:MAG: DUF3089 domain-containing protein [Saprospiraceae bacterium]|nr:DUF3089 domain-containing protein [Saprospiraceae bacterium]
MIRHIFLLFCFIVFLSACYRFKPRTAFDPAQSPPAPDYSTLGSWAAHPDKKDPADQVPCSFLSNNQDSALVDVFFLHPTTLTGYHRDDRCWNGDISNERLNIKTDSAPILFQGSIFNGVGRVYAPFYRQAHLDAFFCDDKTSAASALHLANADALAAFDYYLKHWNKGRPFILAGHSQGGLHTLAILRDRIENTPLEQQLVVAYVVGWPVKPTDLKKIQPCETPDQLDCYCTWRTWERKKGKKKAEDKDVVCTNPLTWSTQPGVYAPKALNRGGVVRPFCAIYPGITDAEVYNGLLLASRPKFQGSILFLKKNYHVGDLNLYYMNVRENAELRAQTYLKRR